LTAAIFLTKTSGQEKKGRLHTIERELPLSFPATCFKNTLIMLRSAFLFLLILVSSSLLAQKYITAAGIRLGGGMGITVNQALWKNYTLEGIVQKGLSTKYTTLSALLEQHHSLLLKELNFYVGAGPHIGTYGKKDKAAGNETVAGASLIGGLELKLGNTLLSADFKPALNVTGGDSFLDSQTGISLRYIFIKAKKKEHKWMFWKRWKKKDQ
jgi:hypothetical protein